MLAAMNDTRSDDDLMLAYGRGDARAFEQLYARYRQPLYRYVYHAVGDSALADDLYQDVWSRIIDARARFAAGKGFRRYAFRIAHNRLVDHWRSHGRQATVADHEFDQLPADDRLQPEAMSEREQQAWQLRQALMRLPPEQREAFLLQQEAGLSLADIAERGGVGRETVKSRLRYAIQRLRLILKPNPEGLRP
jgi:RNA polymerase sigma-70 factor, ECF subfamily